MRKVEKIMGVYCIENTVNNKQYIGSSNNIRLRTYRHLKGLRSNKHHSSHLQRAWNKYGGENFKFYIIEEMKFPENYILNERKLIGEHLICREQYYLDTLKPAYNAFKIAGSGMGYKATPEMTVRRLAAKRTHPNRIKTFKMTMTFELVKEYECTLHATQDINYASSEHVSGCIRGKYSSIGKFVYIGEEEYNSGRFKESRVFRSRPFAKYSEDNKFIKEYFYIKDVVEDGLNPRKVSKCLKGLREQYEGYKFVYL